MPEVKKFIEGDEVMYTKLNAPFGDAIYKVVAVGSERIGVRSPGGSEYLWNFDNITLHSRRGFKIGDQVQYGQDKEVFTITRLGLTGVGLKCGVSGVADAPYDLLKHYTAPPRWAEVCCGGIERDGVTVGRFLRTEDAREYVEWMNSKEIPHVRN